MGKTKKVLASLLAVALAIPGMATGISAKDLTQAEVAKIFYLQVTQYRRYENGESDLPLEWAKKFARFYNVSVDYIGMLIDYPEKLER